MLSTLCTYLAINADLLFFGPSPQVSTPCTHTTISCICVRAVKWTTTEIDSHKLQLEVPQGRLLCQPPNLDPDLLMHTEMIEKSPNNNYLCRKFSLQKCLFDRDDADWCRWLDLRTTHALAWVCLSLLGIPSFWFLLKPGSECT